MTFVAIGTLRAKVKIFHISAGQETSKQALQEIVILPALRPEVRKPRQ